MDTRAWLRKSTPRSATLVGAWLLLSACTSREERAVELVETLADVFEKHGEGDCDKLADKLDAIVSARAEDWEALAQSDKTADGRAKSAKFKKRIGNAVDRIVSHAGKCGTHARVTETLGKIL